MKILVICQHYWPENFRITEICEELAARGHQVTALVGLPNYPTGIIPEEYRYFQNRRQTRNGVEIIRCFEIGRRPGKIGLAVNYVSYMTSASIKALLMKRDYDVVYTFSTSPILMNLPATLLKCLFGKKYIIYVMDIWPASLVGMKISEDALLYRFMKHVSRFIYHKADVLLYSSKKFQDYLSRVHGLDIPDEYYLPQFADELFEKALPSRKADGWVNLVFAGNIGVFQGVDVFLRAAALLKVLPVRWHFIGDGTSYEECMALAEKLELNDHVIFYGRKPLSDMPKYYAMADAMLVSMRSNISGDFTLPGKVQSYMAVGKPVLGAIAGETPYVIEQAGCGLCAPPDDPEAFAQVVRAFIARNDHEQMGQRGADYYQRYFTKKHHIDRLESLLFDLAGGK